jgi:hypothetical protein
LKGTKFKVRATDDARAVAEVHGKEIWINPNTGFFGTGGFQRIPVGLLERGGFLDITLNNIQFAAFFLLHEIGHRTGTLIPDGHDPAGFLSVINNGKIQEACFPEQTPVPRR